MYIFIYVMSHMQRTIEHLQKKQSRTLRELELEYEESDDDIIGAEGSIVLASRTQTDATSGGESEDEEKPMYNPLNLPLGK